MKVVLKTTVLDRILNDLHAAQAAKRTPDYIVLSKEEYNELCTDGRAGYHMMHEYRCYTKEVGVALSESFTARQFPLVTLCSYGTINPSIQVISRESFNGIKLYVVPAEYCPS